jgi:WD40 repeat protein
VWYATWNPAGTLIATTSFDRTVKVWDAQELTQIASFAGHTDEVMMAAFDATGSKLVTTSSDGRLRVWDVSGTPRGLSEQLRACLPLKLEGTKLLPQTPDLARCRWP